MRPALLRLSRALFCLLAIAPLMAQTITEMERKAAVERLGSSRTLFFKSVEGLSEAQWNFKPAPDRWSAGECAEHIVLTEEVYLKTFTRLLDSSPSPDKKAELTDEELLRLFTDRSSKRQAPESIQPKGRWMTRAELIQNFNSLRDRVIAIAETTQAPLRNLTSTAPGGKLMDGYQWFLRFAGHCERHTAQIEEVKAHPQYPKQ